MRKNKRGVTLIEIMIVVALLAVLGAGGTRFFRNTFDLWRGSRTLSRASGDSRTAFNEISTYLRQARENTVSADGSSIYFEVDREEDEWPEGRTVGYFSDGSALKRYMRGSTTTLVTSGVTEFTAEYVPGSAGVHPHVNLSLAVDQGSDRDDLRLDKRIMLRGGREAD